MRAAATEFQCAAYLIMRQQGYIETLVRKGHKVAICEQTEDPRTAIGIVKREVVRIVTPGTMTEGKSIDTFTNHFIGSADMY